MVKRMIDGFSLLTIYKKCPSPKKERASVLILVVDKLPLAIMNRAAYGSFQEFQYFCKAFQ